MTQRPDINQRSADQLRALATELMGSLDAKDQVLGRKERELVRSNAIIEKLSHEVAILKRIGEDISEKLDYVSGEFTVERHIRGEWACDSCETLIQAPVPPQVIDKGIPTASLLAQVLVTKYADHLPLYRQERLLRPCWTHDPEFHAR
jgi:transposase IS66-like protein/transposase IS66 family protein